jgi:hypothetical protein
MLSGDKPLKPSQISFTISALLSEFPQEDGPLSLSQVITEDGLRACLPRVDIVSLISAALPSLGVFLSYNLTERFSGPANRPLPPSILAAKN